MLIAHVASGGAWLLAQAAALPDTIVTIQAPIQPGWFERTTQALSALTTLAFLILTIAVVPAAWSFRKSYKKVSELLDKVYADVNPITHHASRIADNVDYISTAIRGDVQRASATLNAANASLQEALADAETRVREFRALIRVMQEEAEGTFVASASTARGVRVGVATLRDALAGHASDARSADDEFDDFDDAFEADDPLIDETLTEATLADDQFAASEPRHEDDDAESTTKERGGLSRESGAEDGDTMVESGDDSGAEVNAPVRDDRLDVLAAGLVGAAIGAGLGYLLSREAPRSKRSVVRLGRAGLGSARDGLARGKRRGARAVHAAADAGASAGDHAARAGEAFAELLASEVRDLRRAMRKQRRRLGL